MLRTGGKSHEQPHTVPHCQLSGPQPAERQAGHKAIALGQPIPRGREAADADEAVALFRDHLQRHPALVELAQRELSGFDLGCTCPLDQPCHADVWLEVANQAQPP